MSESELEWEKFRDTSVFVHAVNTIGRNTFSTVVLTMLLSDTPITRASLNDEFKAMLKAAHKHGHDEYLKFMLAHAFFDLHVKNKFRESP